MRALVVLALLALLGALATCTGNAAPSARAQRIGSLGDVIGGPHAIGQIGDFLLENDKIRLIIADKGDGRVNTTYGGSLVDADIRRVGGEGARGNDQLAELLPGFAFTVINPTDVQVTRDGADGGPAEVKVTGTGGDLLQMVYLLNTGLLMPANLEFSTTYRLFPGKYYVEIETTVKNKSGGSHPLPYLNPADLDDLLGQEIPNLANLQLSVPMGMLPLLGGEQDLFTPGFGGFNVKFAIEDTYPLAGGFPAFPGMVADFVASRGIGVSYGLTVPASPDNYVNAYKAGYPRQEVTPHSVLIPFTYAGVAGVFMYKPPDQLQPNQEFSFKSYFVVGDGDVASVTDTIYDLRGVVTGSIGGRVVDERSSAPVAGAHVMILKAGPSPLADQPTDLPFTHAETDAQGAFLANLPPGNYKYLVMTDDRVPSEAVPFVVTAGQKTGAFIEMKPPATLAVAVVDDEGRHGPAKIQLVGNFDASDRGKDPRDFLYQLPLGERRRPTAYDGGTRFTEAAWWTIDGRVQKHVRPGTYDLVVSRGPEYEVTVKQITLEPGAFVAEQLVITRAFPSDGWVAGDFHIHAQPSTDSGLPISERVTTCAAEGLEVAVATDHNYITDYAPVIAQIGLDPWLLGIPGLELTTFEMGHFNGYPLRVDPGSTRGGEFEWAGKTPGDLFKQLRDLAVTPGEGIVQVNHPRQQVLGYWAQFYVDDVTAEPYVPTGIVGIFAPYGDEFRPENYSHDYDAVELLTGNRIEDVHTFRAPDPLPPGPFPDPQPVPGEIVLGKDGRAAFPGVVDTWFSMLDRGHKATGMGVSDSHHTLGDEPGYARTMLFVGAGRDTPGGFTRDDVIRAVKDHRAITTNAPFVELIGPNGAMIGDTVKGATVDIEVRVRAPKWARPNKLIVYSNSGTILAEQTIPEAQRTNYSTRVTVRPSVDSWVVAEVIGDDNMFPVLTATEFPPLDATVIITALSAGLDLSSLPLAAKLKPERVHYQRPYAITNPIWIDVDGNGWTPPKTFTRAKAAPVERPDVRKQFDAVQESLGSAEARSGAGRRGDRTTAP